MSVSISGIDELVGKLEGMRFARMVKQVLDGVATIVQGNARVNAPVLTGALRSSLDVSFSNIGYNKSVVGSKLPYAGVREVNNNKHPDTKYYLKRGYTEHTSEINAFVQTVVKQWL